jgi:hypothetical protein
MSRGSNCLADQVMKLITSSVEPIGLYQDLADRLALASGGQITEYSFSCEFSSAVNEYIGKKRKDASK